jgi:pimeloyl-ACP methyl ester carboxylesterase
MPFWCAKLVLACVVRGERWRRIEPLLCTQAVEHELLAAVEDSPQRYAGITADVLLLYGSRSPGFVGRDLLAALATAIPGVSGCALDGLGHAAPTEHAVAVLAQVLVSRITGASDAPEEIRGRG